jgi:hypothetical protein
MLSIERSKYLISPTDSDVINSGLNDERKAFSEYTFRASKVKPKELDSLPRGLLYLMNRGMVFYCLKGPKSFLEKAMSQPGLVGVVGVIPDAAIKTYLDYRSMNLCDDRERKVAKAAKHPCSFVLPYSDIVEIEEKFQIRGTWGKSKGELVRIESQDASNQRRTYWIEDLPINTLPYVLMTLKLEDEASHMHHDFLERATKMESSQPEDKVRDLLAADFGRYRGVVGADIFERALAGIGT